MANKENVDAPPQGDQISPKERVRRPAVPPLASSRRKYGGRELIRIDETVRTLRHCLLDVCRLLKQEGWIDVLDDLKPEDER